MLTEVTRRVRRIRGPIVGAIVSLAAGVSIVAGVYSVVAGAMFDPLPYPSAERIYAVWDMGDSSGRRLVPADLVARLNSSSAGIEAAGSYATAEPSLDIGGGQSLKIKGAIVSPPLLGILGAIPIAGRTFDEADADLTAVPSVVVSERLLRDRRIPAQLEGLLVISGIPHRIIGVLPDEFAFPDREVLIWSALRLPPRSGWSGQALVRVAPFVGGGARSALDSAIRAVGAPERLAVVPLKELLLAEVRPALWLLQSAGLLLLVVAVLGGMWGFSTDAWERRSEFAMKGVLGASQWRVLRDYLSDAGLVALVTASVGALMCSVATSVAFSRWEAYLPHAPAGLTGRAIVACGVLSGAAVAVACSPGLLIALRAATTRRIGKHLRGRSVSRFDQLVTTVQVALVPVQARLRLGV